MSFVYTNCWLCKILTICVERRFEREVNSLVTAWLCMWPTANKMYICLLLAGKPSKFMVATTCPGTGLLTVAVQGPSKVPMTCTEFDEGYEFSYTPKAPGHYLIAVKYCHVSVPGSPYQSIVIGECTYITESSHFCNLIRQLLWRLSSNKLYWHQMRAAMHY